MLSAVQYMKRYGTSYYYATLFFPNKIKKKVILLYKFVRIPDLVVDNESITDKEAKNELQMMRDDWEKAYNNKDIKHIIR